MKDFNKQKAEQLLPPSPEKAIGEKAETLIKMAAAGYPVPHFYAVSNSFFQSFLKENNLGPDIEQLLDNCNWEDHQNIAEVHQKIRALLMVPDHSKKLRSKVTRICTCLNGPLIVRSSAIGEDSAGDSFAGQLDSFSTDNSVDEVLDAVRKCWVSYWSERSMVYQRRKKKKLKGMGVIIQEELNPLFAGVVFSINPASNENEMLIEFCHGHGEQLVSGMVTPGRISVDRGTNQFSVTQRYNFNSSDTHSVSFEEQNALIEKLISHSFNLENMFDIPLDIEWAADHAQNLFILQARPITTLAERKNKIYWSNVNVNENYPEPLSPFLYSLARKSYYFYFKNLAGALGMKSDVILEADHLFSNIIGAHGARMYYNMTNIHRAIRLLPLGRQLSSFFDDFVGYHDDNKNELERGNSKHPHPTARRIRFFLFTIGSLLTVPLRVNRFEKTADAHLLTGGGGEIRDTDDLFRFQEQLRGFVRIRFFKWNDAALCDFSAMVSYGILGLQLKKIYPEHLARARLNLLLQGIPDLVSSIPSEKIWDLATQIRKSDYLSALFASPLSSSEILEKVMDSSEEPFKHAFRCFINSWGYRCSGELMLTEKNFLDEPEKVIDLIQGYLGKTLNSSPRELINQKSKERRKLIEKVKQDLQFNSGYLSGFLKFWVVRVLLFWTEKSISYRERVRLKQALLYGYLRKTLLGLGKTLAAKGVLTHQSDIFFCKYDELLDFLAGAEILPETLQQLLLIRRSEHKKQADRDLPDAFYLDEGAYATTSTAPPPEIRAAGSLYHGTSACGGFVKGTARILNSVFESKRIQPGDILVVRQTDPGWAPVFPLISGLVVERGGMLSHGAIVAREYGIPAVVGIKHITKLVKDGMEILVNGENGSVQF